MFLISDDENMGRSNTEMPKIIDMMTRKKWTGSRMTRPPAKVGGSTARCFRRSPGGNGFEPIGDIADRVVRQLRTR
jgi:hypothetical protein